MRIILLLAFFTLFSGLMKAQNAFNDAMDYVTIRDFMRRQRAALRVYKTDTIKSSYKAKLEKHKEMLVDIDSLISFPFKYTLKNTKLPSRKTAQTLIAEVQEILSYLENSRFKPEDYFFANIQESHSLMQNNGLPFAQMPTNSLLSATSFVDGTAIFLKKRVKEELNLAFLNRFRESLDTSLLLKQLMPTSLTVLKAASEMETALPSLTNMMLNAFQSDMEQLPENIEAAMLNPQYFRDYRDERGFKYFALPFNVVKHLKLGSHPAYVLEDITDKYFPLTDNTEIDTLMNLLVFFNEQLRDVESDVTNKSDKNAPPMLIPLSRWNELRQKGGQMLFAALLLQYDKKKLLRPIHDMQIETSENQAKLDKIVRKITESIDDFIVQINGFEEDVKQIRKSSLRMHRDSIALEITWNVMQLVDKSHALYADVLSEKEGYTPRQTYWQKYKPIAESTLKMLRSAQRRNYSALILSSFEILKQLSNEPKIQEKLHINPRFLQDFLFYGNFMTDILLAQNSEEISDILDRYAAPVGSYTIKRTNHFSVSFNAYPGFFVATERPFLKQQYQGVREWGFVSGVTAPLGLAISRGGLGEKANQNATIFVSAIDIGAILSYRWTNDAAVGLPQEIEWAQILSPGVHLMWGLPNVPLVLSAGYQIAPKLRKIGTVGNQNFDRISVGIAADITMFNLYHDKRVAPRNKKR